VPLDNVVFWVFAPVAVGSAIAMLLMRNAVHAALLLIVNFFCLAVMYLLLDAPFLFAVQIIVYAGAIMVLFLFVIMLLGVDDVDDLRIEPFKIQRPLAAIASVALVGLVITAVVQTRDALGTPPPINADIAAAAEAGAHDANIRALARDLFSNHVFAFELTSALLVIAVVGTVLLSRRLNKSGTTR